MARHRKPSYVTFSQDFDLPHWPGWDSALIRSGQAEPILQECVRRIEAAGGEISGAWMVIHDQDTFPDGTRKHAHVHGLIQQGAAKLHCTEIDQALGFDKSVVRSPNRGARIENAQAYLIHAKHREKHQYDVGDVATVRGQDYGEIEAQHRGPWARRAVMGPKAAVSRKEWSELVDALVQRVLDGEVDELDILKDKTLGDIYVRGVHTVDLALRHRTKVDMMEEVEKLRANVFLKTPIWIMGQRQQGKSWLAESIVADLVAQLGWRVFRATAKNGPDDYNGEEVILLNEPGPRVMEWADFLVLLDPRHAGPISARFYNKPDSAPRVIIVAVSIDPVEFGFFMPGKRSTDDSLDQLLARLALVIEADKVDGVPRYTVSRIGEVVPHSRAITIPSMGTQSARTETLSLGYGATVGVSDLSRDEALDEVLSEVARRSPDVGLNVEDSRLDQRTDELQAQLESSAERALADTNCQRCRQRVLSNTQIPMWDGHEFWCDH